MALKSYIGDQKTHCDVSNAPPSTLRSPERWDPPSHSPSSGVGRVNQDRLWPRGGRSCRGHSDSCEEVWIPRDILKLVHP